MTEVLLHFDVDPGSNIKVAAAELQVRCATLSTIRTATCEAVVTRGVSDVVLVLNLATDVLTAAASTLVALKLVIEMVKAIAAELGLRNVEVEVGIDEIAPEALTEAHTRKLIAAKPGPRGQLRRRH
jgi:hypothetical protein